MQNVVLPIEMYALIDSCHMKCSFLLSCKTFDVVRSWEFKVDKVFMANACLFSQSGFQRFTFYLSEPMGNDGVIKAFVEYLELCWVFKAAKDLHGNKSI